MLTTTGSLDPNLLWLDPIPEQHRALAVAALADGDTSGFLYSASAGMLLLVIYNKAILIQLGLYEAALLEAYTSLRGNSHSWPMDQIRSLFLDADRARLRAAGDPLPPLPESGQYTLYRGVAGRGRARRVRGISWTASLEEAQWFAKRWERFKCLPDPAVFRVTVGEQHVLAYIERPEQEFLVMLPDSIRPVRMVMKE